VAASGKTYQENHVSGPLKGYRILEIAGIGPAPFAAMMLADQGAEVIRIDRVTPNMAGINVEAGFEHKNLLNRSRRSIAIDLKQPEGIALVLEMARHADGLIEGFRPGVMERLGLGPEACHKANAKLVYGRMTGWGQDGPMAKAVGHDINYIALAGALHAFGRAGEKPTPPINMVGDFGGGGMLMAFGMVCALLEAQKSGQGQVIDAAMVDGSALLMTMMWAFRALGQWQDDRGVNLLDTGAYFYDTYETSDGKYIALGAIEPPFYADFLKRMGLADDADFAKQMYAPDWPRLRIKLAAHFKTRSRDDWAALLEGTDACVSPVLSMSEAPEHPHIKARNIFVDVAGVTQPAPAPRYSRTINDTPTVAPKPGAQSADILHDLGFAADRVTALQIAGVIV
jgi:alpha-methylacyl-CoA racemase